MRLGQIGAGNYAKSMLMPYFPSLAGLSLGSICTTKGANAEVEIYPDTHHGFAFPKRPVYHRDAAERHWERLLALYRRNLRKDQKA